MDIDIDILYRYTYMYICIYYSPIAVVNRVIQLHWQFIIYLSYVLQILKNVEFPNWIYDFQVEATGGDEKCNIYQIYGPEKHKDVFKINPKTGIIRTRKRLDFETNPRYSIQLKVWNSVNDPSSFSLSNSTLMVNVTDVNEPPRFTEPTCLKTILPCQYTIEENKIDGIVQVTASDPDITECLLTYEIASSNKQYFYIDAESRNIMTKRNGLDREHKSNYQIDVQVYDCGEPALYDKLQIHLTVTDKNDNFPIFNKNYTKDVKEDKKINSPVLKVTATGEEGKF